MKQKIITSALVSILFVFLGTGLAFSQITEPNIKEKRVTLKLNRGHFRDIMDYLIIKQGVQVGFEESILDRDHNDYDFNTNLIFVEPNRIPTTSGFTPIKKHWFTLDIENESLENFLNIVVGQMENYKWEINDGVVNIFPSQGRSQEIEKLLNLSINTFTVDKNKPIFLIREKLFELPEIENFLIENELPKAKNRDRINFLKRKLSEEIIFSNLRFKELLNKITKLKKGAWIIKQSDTYDSKVKLYIEIDI